VARVCKHDKEYTILRTVPLMTCQEKIYNNRRSYAIPLPGERLPEEQVGKMFNVSRSPVREVLLALEKEDTVVMEPYKGASMKPLSPKEAWDIAILRLALITFAAKPAYRRLSPTDFDLAYGLAKETTRISAYPRLDRGPATLLGFKHSFKQKYSSVIFDGRYRGCALDHMRVRDSVSIGEMKNPVPSR